MSISLRDVIDVEASGCDDVTLHRARLSDGIAAVRTQPAR
jgi:hypothetical protein